MLHVIFNQITKFIIFESTKFCHTNSKDYRILTNIDKFMFLGKNMPYSHACLWKCMADEQSKKIFENKFRKVHLVALHNFFWTWIFEHNYEHKFFWTFFLNMFKHSFWTSLNILFQHVWTFFLNMSAQVLVSVQKFAQQWTTSTVCTCSNYQTVLVA